MQISYKALTSSPKAAEAVSDLNSALSRKLSFLHHRVENKGGQVVIPAEASKAASPEAGPWRKPPSPACREAVLVYRGKSTPKTD